MLNRAIIRLAGRRACFGLVLGMLLFAPGYRVRADNVKDHYDKAVKLYKDQKLDEALVEFKAAHDAAPNNPNPLYWIGFINLEKRDYVSAREPLEQAVKLNPGSADAHLNLGNVYDGLKQYDKAAGEFQTVIRLKPNSPDAYYNLGSVYFKMHRTADSVAAYRRAAAMKPDDPYFEDGLGFALQANGDYAGAVAAYRKALASDPKNADILVNQALAAAALAQSQPDPRSARAEDAWSQARSALAQAVQLRPADYKIRETYAETLVDSGREGEAVNQFSKAAELDATQFNPLFNLGLAEFHLGRLNDAADAYRRALALQPESVIALKGLGQVQMKQKDWNGAATTYQHLTQITPDDLTAWINLSASMQGKKDKEGEFAALQEAVKHGGADPNGPRLADIHRALGNYYYAKLDPDSLKKAREEYLYSLRGAPHNADTLNGLGLVAHKMSNYPEAINYFQQAIGINPKNADFENNLGVAYEAAGKRSEAIASYQRALQLEPTNDLARRNLARFTATPK